MFDKYVDGFLNLSFDSGESWCNCWHFGVDFCHSTNDAQWVASTFKKLIFLIILIIVTVKRYLVSLVLQ